jgi:hypothetical protein
MRTLWLASLLLGAGVGDQAGLFEVRVSDVRVGSIDDQGSSTGALAPIPFEPGERVACHLDRSPGKKPLEIWFKGTTDATGKLRALGSGEYSQQMPARGGASDDAAVCAFSAFTSAGVVLKPRTNLEVRVRATFERRRR